MRYSRRRRGRRLGLIGCALLLEVILEQYFPLEISSRLRVVFLIKDLCQSLAVVVLATKAAGLSSRRWHALGMLALLNGMLTFAAAMYIGSDQFQDFLRNLYPRSTQLERIHRRYKSE